MEDLTKYIPQDNGWIKEYSDIMGEERLLEYYNRVFLCLYGMKHGERLYILNEVAPSNYRLFISVACTVVNELTSYGFFEFSIEEQATIICRD